MSRARPLGTRLAVVAVAALLIGACGDGGGDAPPSDSAADTIAETSGDAGGDTAVPPSGPTGCVIGTLACRCGEGNGCALDPDGEPLTCVAGVCLRPTCPSGSLGCPCRAGGCDQGSCEDDMCVAAGCAPGTLNCACASGSCDVGLFCKGAAVCVDQTGYEGGPCLANGGCHEGNRCDAAQGRCVYCDRGTQGCACATSGTCNSGLTCAANVCAAAAELPPAEPRCYTPCREDLVTGNTTRACSAEGLLEGCVDDQACVDGSCVRPGQAKPGCASDIECPFFQACLGGGCYSNCETNLDCPSGTGCHQKVCRVPCLLTTGNAACPEGQTCDSADGQTGFCIAVMPPDETPLTLPGGSAFEVQAQRLSRLTNLMTTGKILITPESPVTQRLVIEKRSHTLYDANGNPEVIDAPVDEQTGEPLPCEGAATDCPLWWIELSDGVTTTRADRLEIECPGGVCPEITVSNADGGPGVRFDGRLAVYGDGGSHEVALRYVEEVAGRWEGQVHYFTIFKDEGVDAWVHRADKSDVSEVKNALIQRWGAFRRGNVDGWQEFEAVLTATRTGSWKQPRTKELCAAVSGNSPDTVCYPYAVPAGVSIYVEDGTEAEVPSATTELPLALQVRPSYEGSKVYAGRIDSATALQYPGNPWVSVTLAADPALPGSCDPRIPSACVVYVTGLSAQVSLGARYLSESGACMTGFTPKTYPWLIPGFTDGTRVDAETGAPTRTECRDALLPYEPLDDVTTALDADLAGSNPAPDGVVRKRTLELLDGALVDQTTLFLLVRERFESFIPGQPPVSAYAYITLRRTPTDLEDADFLGNEPQTIQRPEPDLDRSCDPDLLAQLPEDVRGDLDRLTRVLIEGSSGDTAAFALDPVTDVDNQIHYYCDGYFDGGGELETVTVDPLDNDPPAGDGYVGIGETDHTIVVQLPNPCLPGSKVVFFDTGTNKTQLEVLKDACQTDGTCESRLQQWVESHIVEELNPTWRCEDPTRALCDVNVKDLRDGKRFFRKRANAPSFSLPRLSAAIDSAFRFKTRFQSNIDADSEVGFAPIPCVPGSDLVPYCYDAGEIEAIRDRVDCLIDIYTNDIAALGTTAKEELEGFLRGSFSEQQGHDGFERLYVELLVMLGDEELTGAFASRFDLAGVSTRSFDGEHFEIDGINLTGVSGAEMERLYAATQYYEMALDRLYLLGPNIAEALSRGNTSTETNMISPETVTLYLARLVRASAQSAAAWSEIAKRYRDFNRTDIARRVLERAYARTYTESVMLARLMLDITAQTGLSFQDQIISVLERAQRTFRVAMLDMRDVFDTIVEGATFFGYPPEYVPFPAIDTSTTAYGTNGFEVLLTNARTRLQIAKERENIAFDSLASGQLDEAQFQSELVNVRNNYADQLATLCGVFQGDDGTTYPAIRKYAQQSALALATGDPCAMFGNGTIYEQMLEVDTTATALDGVLTRYRNVQAEIEDEKTRVSAQCDLIRELAEFQYVAGGKVRDVTRDQAITQTAIGGAVRLLTTAKEAVDGYTSCTLAITPIDKISCGTMAGISAGLGVGAAIAEGVSESLAIGFQYDIATKNLETGRWVTQTQCDAQLIDSAAKMKGLIRSLDEVTLEALRTQVQLELQVAQVKRAFNEAQRLQERQAEAQQLLINVTAAKNDPNVRIYRNDAVINADIAFQDAMRAAYRATRMYEYYTSTSYDRLDELFLIRLAARGLPNLENYLTDLENAFQDFEEELGLPDPRIAILSLRDDILKIPYIDADKKTIETDERIRLFHAALEDPSRLDKNGYIVFPFGTSVDELSPLTRNHKIRYVEANIIGSEIGDRLARIYLRQRGTSVLETVDDRTDYYVFPERTAVIDVFFNGNRVYPPEVYQNLRLRDRPYAQTMWELVFNRRDEAVNRDIDLSSVSDIQLFIHYTDFTVF